MTEDYYNLFSIDGSNLNINSKHLNVNGIFLCVCNELLGQKIKDADDLQNKITNSEALKTIKSTLFFKLSEARMSQRGYNPDKFEKIEKVDCYDDEDIYVDKSGNRVNLSALKAMEINLFEDICEYSNAWGINIFNLDDGDTAFDRVVKVMMGFFPSSINITNYQVITNEEVSETDIVTNYAVDVTVQLYGSEWVVQTWNGQISKDCQTTVDGNYLELSTPAFSEQLHKSIQAICCHVANIAIDNDMSSALMTHANIAAKAQVMFNLLPPMENATASTYAIMADRLSNFPNDNDAAELLRLTYQCTSDVSRKLLLEIQRQ